MSPQEIVESFSSIPCQKINGKISNQAAEASSDACLNDFNRTGPCLSQNELELVNSDFSGSECAIDDDDEFEEDTFEPLHRCAAHQSRQFDTDAVSVEYDPPLARQSISSNPSTLSIVPSQCNGSDNEIIQKPRQRPKRRTLRRIASSLSFLSRTSTTSSNKSGDGVNCYEKGGTREIVAT